MISSKLYNNENEGLAKHNKISAGIVVQIISIIFEWLKTLTVELFLSK